MLKIISRVSEYWKKNSKKVSELRFFFFFFFAQKKIEKNFEKIICKIFSIFCKNVKSVDSNPKNIRKPLLEYLTIIYEAKKKKNLRIFFFFWSTFSPFPLKKKKRQKKSRPFQSFKKKYKMLSRNLYFCMRKCNFRHPRTHPKKQKNIQKNFRFFFRGQHFFRFPGFWKTKKISAKRGGFLV